MVQLIKKTALIALLVILASISNAFSQMRDPVKEERLVMLCIGNANAVGQIALYRDDGISQKTLEDQVGLKKMEASSQKEFKDEIDRVYKNKDKSPQHLAEDYFGRCLITVGLGKPL